MDPDALGYTKNLWRLCSVFCVTQNRLQRVEMCSIHRSSSSHRECSYVNSPHVRHQQQQRQWQHERSLRFHLEDDVFPLHSRFRQIGGVGFVSSAARKKYLLDSKFDFLDRALLLLDQNRVQKVFLDSGSFPRNFDCILWCAYVK